MKSLLFFLLLAVAFTAPANPLQIEWQRSFGGTNFDQLTSLRQSEDGGHILCGYSYSTNSGNKASPNYGLSDGWLIKLDAGGNKVWEQNIGGTNVDLANYVLVTNGQYVICGASSSLPSGNKTSTNYGPSDVWLFKLDANGTKLWDQSYGGTSLDSATEVQPTSDGGYIIAAISGSGINGNKTAGNFGVTDAWAIKTDANGNKVWDKTFGGSNVDGFRCVRPTSDGGYLFAGNSWSPASGNKTNVYYGGAGGDYWIVKTDAAGNKEWDKAFGGTASEIIIDMCPASGGGWIMAGYSASPISGTKTTTNYGMSDYWIIKLDVNYNQVWEVSYGGTGNEQLRNIHPTSDGGYIIAGESTSGISGNKTNASFGTNDFWIIKLNANGNKIAEWSFGGTDDDSLASLHPTSDGGYILGGYSFSAVSGNKTTATYGACDYWVIKTGIPVPRLTSSLSGANVVVSWPSPSTGFVLQENSNLAVTNWSTVGPIPSDDGTNKSVTLPASAPKNFFRLKQL